MGRRGDLSGEQIAAIINLHEAKQPARKDSRIVGVTVRSVQRWIKKFRDSNGATTP